LRLRWEMLSEERLDVVDAFDRVEGQAARGEIHRLGLRHRAVHIFVVNRVGEVLLQKRSMLKDTWPGAWDSSAAGHLAAGEEYEAAAWREVEEEIGWRPEAGGLREIGRLDACRDTGEEFVRIYRAEGEGPFRFPPEEIERLAWFSSERIDAAIANDPEELASAFRRIWQDFRRRILNG
jgi:isopentenyldiphosphate isomerase